MFIRIAEAQKAAECVETAFIAALELNDVCACADALEVIQLEAHTVLCYLLGIADSNELSLDQTGKFLKSFLHRFFPSTYGEQMECPRVHEAAKALMDEFFIVTLPAITHDTYTTSDRFQQLFFDFLVVFDVISKRVETCYEAVTLMQCMIGEFTAVDDGFMSHMVKLNEYLETMRAGNYLDLFEQMHYDLMEKILGFMA